ncbi:MAG: trypsin-like peptidase domain-containing protein [Caldilineales bacterium]|nr:trypsin-like peptidase domain-containing protein [Caldilineales bacterium]MCX7852107.1 trypsin-like peptidase domain-containing protein [Caldilineales bacterium]
MSLFKRRIGWFVVWLAVAMLLVSGGVALGSVLLPTASAETTAAPTPPALSTAAEVATAFQEQLVAIYEKAGPSVVHVRNQRAVVDFFGQVIPQGGTGTGFIYDTQGHIVTNYHVIEGAQALDVTLADGRTFPATLVGSDPVNDLAVIRIKTNETLPPPLPLANSDELRVGQIVLAIGNPFGLEQTLTMGIVSALGRVIQSPENNRFIGEVIQTDAAINPGNSGGPLLDLQGRVIGVNTQIVSPSGASAGIGFAVSANTVARVVPVLIARGSYPHPWLGVRVLELTPSVATLLEQAGMTMPVREGLLILETVTNGPAARAGLRAPQRVVQVGNTRVPVGGDVIVRINDAPIRTFQDLTVYLETKTRSGEMVTVTVIRDGKEQNIRVRLGTQPR